MQTNKMSFEQKSRMVDEIQKIIENFKFQGNSIDSKTFLMILIPLKTVILGSRSSEGLENEPLCKKSLKSLFILVKNFDFSLKLAMEILFLNSIFRRKNSEFIYCSDDIKILYLKILKTIFKKHPLLPFIEDFTFLLTINSLIREKSFEIIKGCLGVFQNCFMLKIQPLSYSDFSFLKHALKNIFPGLATTLFEVFMLENKREIIQIKIIKTFSFLISIIFNNFCVESLSNESLDENSDDDLTIHLEKTIFIISKISDIVNRSEYKNLRIVFTVFLSRFFINSFEKISRYFEDLSGLFLKTISFKELYLFDDLVSNELKILFNDKNFFQIFIELFNKSLYKKLYESCDIFLINIVLNTISVFLNSIDSYKLLLNIIRFLKIKKIKKIASFENAVITRDQLYSIDSNNTLFNSIVFRNIESRDIFDNICHLLRGFFKCFGFKDFKLLEEIHQEDSFKFCEFMLIISGFLDDKKEVLYNEEYLEVLSKIMKILINDPFSENTNLLSISDFESKILMELNIFENLSIQNQNLDLLIFQKLEIYGKISNYMGFNFKRYLHLILYSIISFLGSENEAIRISCNNTLIKIALSTGYESTKDLIKDNIDYIIDSAYKNISRQFYICTGITIIRVLIEFFPSDELLSILVLDSFHVLIKMINNFRESALCHAIKLFYAYIEAVYKFYKIKQPKKPKELFRELNNSESYIEYFKALKSGFDFDTGYFKEKKEEKLPPQFKLVNDILDVISHYITSYSKTLSIWTLKTCEYGLKTLAAYENQRLPLVHKIWIPLMYHVRNKNFFIYPTISSMIESMVLHSKEFVNHRISTEFLPCVLSHLSECEQLKISTISSKGTSHIVTRISFIKVLKSMLESLDLKESDLYNINCLSLKLKASKNEIIREVNIFFIRHLHNF